MTELPPELKEAEVTITCCKCINPIPKDSNDFRAYMEDKLIPAKAVASFLETTRKELRHYFCERYRINKKGRSWCEDVTDLCFSCRKIVAVFGGERK